MSLRLFSNIISGSVVIIFWWVLSNKADLGNYLNIFWNDFLSIVFPSWCAACSHKLLQHEKSLCLSCFQEIFDFEQFDMPCVKLALLNFNASAFLQKVEYSSQKDAIYEAIFLVYLLNIDPELKAVIVVDEPCFFKFQRIKNLYSMRFFDEKISWRNCDVIFLSIHSAKAYLSYFLELSDVKSFKSFALKGFLT